jgi:adenylate cyclase
VPQEIERKFLVRDESWRPLARSSVRIRQGYIVIGKKASVRVRLKGDRGWLGLKGATPGVSRAEFDYEIPAADARQMMETLCARPLIDKTRHFVDHGGRRWEIDVFEGDNLGLVVAEIELASEEERFELPPWAGEEVSDDRRYYNASLVSLPYSRWKGP